MRFRLLVLLIPVFAFATARDHEYLADDGSDDYHGASQESPANDHADEGGDHGQENHAEGGVDHPPVDPVIQHEENADHDATTTSPCQFNDLVKCLTEPLDEWAVNLYAMKENIVAIKGHECLGARESIRQCIEERAWRDFQCDHANILAVSARVTDLLVHKQGSGNWLRSYYVTAYVCTEEGGAIRDAIPETCLKQEHIGQMTFDAIKFMDEKLSNNHTATGRQRCDYLNTRAQLMRSIANQKCAHNEPVKAGLLMCETIKRAFLKMHPEMFENGDHKCDFECPQNNIPVVHGGTEEAPTPDEPSDPSKADANHDEHKTADDAKGAAGIASSILLLLTSAAFGLLQRTIISP